MKRTGQALSSGTMTCQIDGVVCSGRGGNFNRAPGSQQQNNSNPTKKNTLKFDEEYDFDKANSEFEELKNKTAKLKISGKHQKFKFLVGNYYL